MGDEDCLTLDVFAPRFEPESVPGSSSRIPVLFWIHGGPSVGRGGFYDGGNLAARTEVVVVVVNYRLGPFGWFRHAALRADAVSAADRSGSFALLDLLLALKWVRANVAAFGGDPGRITIAGEGFGAWSVGALLRSPPAAGLFHRAILHSTPGWGSPSASEAENWTSDPKPGWPTSSNEILAKLLVRDGTARDTPGAMTYARSMTPAQIESYLRSRPAREILAAYVEDPVAHSGGYEIPVGVRDGVVLVADAPLENLRNGGSNLVPILIGSTRDEKKLVQALDPAYVRWRFGLFPQAIAPARYDAEAHHHANVCRITTVDAAAQAVSERGGDVYAFRFDWDEEPRVPLFYDGPHLLGAAHGLVGPFMFGHFELGPQTSFVFGRGSAPGRDGLSGTMMSYWSQFAATGSPARGRRRDLPEWTPWDPAKNAPKRMLLDTPDGGGVRMSSETQTLAEAVRDLLRDRRIRELRDRCGALLPWGCVSDEQYAEVVACRGHPRSDFQ